MVKSFSGSYSSLIVSKSDAVQFSKALLYFFFYILELCKLKFNAQNRVLQIEYDVMKLTAMILSGKHCMS